MSEFRFKEVYERALRESYPGAFNWRTLEGLGSFEKRIAYVDSHLKRIGAGSSRITYAVDEDKVLKVAKNRKGLAQNQEEIRIGSYPDVPDVLAKVFESSDDYTFLEMERGETVSRSDFLRLTGVSIDSLAAYLRYFGLSVLCQGGERPSRPENADELEDNEFVQELCDLGGSWDFKLPGDFDRLSTYGRVVRDGQETIAVIDFGFHGDVVDLYRRI